MSKNGIDHLTKAKQILVDIGLLREEQNLYDIVNKPATFYWTLPEAITNPHQEKKELSNITIGEGKIDRLEIITEKVIKKVINIALITSIGITVMTESDIDEKKLEEKELEKILIKLETNLQSAQNMIIHHIEIYDNQSSIIFNVLPKAEDYDFSDDDEYDQYEEDCSRVYRMGISFKPEKPSS